VLRGLLVASAITALAVTSSFSGTPEDVSRFYGRAYFGDAIGSGLTLSQQRAFDRGASLFSKNWSGTSSLSKNGNSCVSCHSVPAPGGSGMSDSALVTTRVQDGRTVVVYASDVERRSSEKRRTPPLFGLGLLESSDMLLAPDGERRAFLGALGEHNNIESAVRHAVRAELGLRTQQDCAKEEGAKDSKCRASISESQISDLIAFVRLLAAPPRLYSRYGPNAKGANLFRQVGCAACHTPSFDTRKSPFPTLRASGLNAYSDFRQHDLGGRQRVRTTPLWGINSYGPPYWHDGSANSIEQAIGKHASEGIYSLNAYQSLSEEERELVLKFLKAL
jgi:CxxC motif-containing protein (DUF1111 family)